MKIDHNRLVAQADNHMNNTPSLNRVHPNPLALADNPRDPRWCQIADRMLDDVNAAGGGLNAPSANPAGSHDPDDTLEHPERWDGMA